MTEKLVRVRSNFRKEFGDELADYVEFFKEDRYLYFSTVAANITFGYSHVKEFRRKNLPRSEYFLKFLDDAQLRYPLLLLGADLARQTVDILANVPKEAIFYEQSPISPDDFDEYERIVDRLEKESPHNLPDEVQSRLLELGLNYVPGVHKMVALPDMLETMILQARLRLRETIEEERPDAITFFRESAYIHNQTILDNILFGKMTTDNPTAQEKINQSMIQLLIEEDLLEEIVEIGMHYEVGTYGDKLSGGQRQKLAIARTFLKESPLLIMDEATSALDNKSQSRIQAILESKWRGRSTLIAVVHRLDIIKNYDKVAVMKAGKVVEMGEYEELMAKKGMLHELVHGRKG
jgi:ABC-type polar amino acid transport system ATPase subunit